MMSRTRRWCLVGVLVLLLTALLPGAGLAQEPRLRVSLKKNFGFSLGARIQGRFTISATGPADTTAVTFYIDGEEMGTVSQAPFQMAFETGRYSPGTHTLHAVGTTAGGGTVRSSDSRVEILSGASATQATQGLLLPLLAAVLAVMVLGALGTMWLSGRRAKTAPTVPQSYGVAGGAICPRCGRPFARNFLSLNLAVGKLERCPYCGKIAVVRAASPAALAAAEAAMVAASRPSVAAERPEEKLRRQIEESRYG
jgi:DNA-directed RNA polymerase subunit RPC12/RpoP